MDQQHTFVLLLKDLFWLWRAEIDRRLVPLGLSQAQWQPLLLLYREGRPMTQSELAGRLHVESPTLVRLLDRLSTKGWIERRACPGDRRAHHVYLTTQALGLCEEITRIAAAARADLFKGTGKEELAKGSELLARLKQQAEALQSSSVGAAGKGLASPAAAAAKRRIKSR